MFFDKIIYGIQYYRAPTPLPDEWDYDLSHMVDWLSVDTIQLRIQWRQNEPREGEYRFDDIDRLMELAHKYKLKVIIKFLLENAPQYVFEKHDGYRVDASGGIIRSGSHGAYYVGGWLPCFSNPGVREAARKFVRKVAERYAGHKTLILWNAWNEPRNRPVGECYCEHCRKAYSEWLKESYGTVENLNSTFGVAEESFETVQLPAMTQGYWDIYLFKKWKSGRFLYDTVKLVADCIKQFDSVHPVMTHVGCPGVHQSFLGDLCNDFEVSKAVDFYGSSYIHQTDMDIHENRLIAQFTADFMRCVDENFFIHEIYPGLGMFREYDKPDDLSFKLWSVLAAGAKGMLYWQYRAERVGCESDCAGIVGMDGEKRDVTAVVKNFGDFLHANEKLLAGAKPVCGDVAILYDYDSMLVSFIEDGSCKLFDLCSGEDALSYYTNAHQGVYAMMRDLDLNVDYITAEKIKDGFSHKVVYLSDYELVDETIEEALYKFVSDGGLLIADEGFGMRDRKNLWINTGNLPLKSLVDAKAVKRRRCDQTVEAEGKKLAVTPYRTWFDTPAKPLFTFDDGCGAAYEYSVGKGKVLLLGASAGYAYSVGSGDGWRDFIGKFIFANADVQTQKYSDARGGIYHRSMHCAEGRVELVQNWSGDNARIVIPADAKILTDQVSENNEVVICDRSTLCFVVPEKR